MIKKLWAEGSLPEWQAALDSYEPVVAGQTSKVLPDLDHWFRKQLPRDIAGRHPRHITLDDLARLTEWKMARGVWRPRNITLVRGNDPELVISSSTAAFLRIPDCTGPITELAKLAGVGPATASAAASAAAPEHYPFFDDLVATQIPKLGRVDYTVAYYTKYAAAIRERARALGGGWTPMMVEQALYANSGGKAGVKKPAD